MQAKLGERATAQVVAPPSAPTSPEAAVPNKFASALDAARTVFASPEVASLRAALAAEKERADRLKADRAALLMVKTTEGLTASEWMMRTAHAEEKARAAEGLAKALDLAHAALDLYHPTEDDDGFSGYLDRLGMEFYNETRVWPHFKSPPMEMYVEGTTEERQKRWTEWLRERRDKAVAAARAALAEKGGGTGGAP